MEGRDRILVMTRLAVEMKNRIHIHIHIQTIFWWISMDIDRFLKHDINKISRRFWLYNLRIFKANKIIQESQKNEG